MSRNCSLSLQFHVSGDQTVGLHTPSISSIVRISIHDEICTQIKSIRKFSIAETFQWVIFSNRESWFTKKSPEKIANWMKNQPNWLKIGWLLEMKKMTHQFGLKNMSFWIKLFYKGLSSTSLNLVILNSLFSKCWNCSGNYFKL